MVTLDVGTWENVGRLRIDPVLTHNRIEVPMNSLELFKAVVELGGK